MRSEHQLLDKVSKFLFNVSVRFKADLSLEEFSSALADAVAGNLSQLVLAFEPSGDFGTFGDFAERRVLEEGVDSPAEVVGDVEVRRRPPRHRRRSGAAPSTRAVATATRRSTTVAPHLERRPS